MRSHHIRRLAVAVAVVAPVLSGPAPDIKLRAQGPGPSELEKAWCVPRVSATSPLHEVAGVVRFVGTDVDAPIQHPRPAEAALSSLSAARSYLSECGSLFGVSHPDTDLHVLSSRIVEGGRSVIRFRQTHRGVPVMAAELIVHVDSGRNIRAVAGRAAPGLDVDTTPLVVPQDAAHSAVAVVAETYGLDPAALTTTTPELLVYSAGLLRHANENPPSLVWRIDVTPSFLSSIRELVLIDAQDGSVSLHFNQVRALRNRETYTANNSTTLPGTLVCGESNPTCAGGDSHAIGAHLGTGDTYDFYAATHGRDGIDGAGSPIISTVHYGLGTTQAFWNGTQMVYGDGKGLPLADDVVGHELTHVVTEHTSGLLNYYESGAISESFSDLWGELIDQTNGRGTDTPAVKWLIGEDIPGTGAFRNMSNPPAFGHPDRMTSLLYALGAGDNFGVHTNAGVNNKAAFLMIDGGTFSNYHILPLGITKVAKIYYEAQTNLLTPAAGHIDLFNALQQACTNLVGTSGITIVNCQEVGKAVTAVEMHLDPNPPPSAPFTISPTDSVWVTTPTYRWHSLGNATAYHLWVNDSTATPKVTYSITAEQAGCGPTAARARRSRPRLSHWAPPCGGSERRTTPVTAPGVPAGNSQ